MTREIHGVLGIVRDITERKKAEAESAELARRNAAIITTLRQIVHEWRPLTDELVWDGQFTKVLSYSADEMGHTTASWTDRMHPDDLGPVMAEVENAMRGRRNYGLEYRFRHRDGS